MLKYIFCFIFLLYINYNYNFFCPGLHKSRFSIPQHSFNEWQEAVGTPLTKRSRICGAHFSKNDIYDTWTSGEGSNQYLVSCKFNF